MNEAPTTPAKKGPDIVLWSAVVGMMVLIFVVVLPNFIKARNTSSATSCVNHLRKIDNAIQQWALESGKGPTNSVDAAILGDYIIGGVVPTCPQGGTYRIGATVGANPSVTCSYQGHVLP
jgi:hypothetical protein